MTPANCLTSASFRPWPFVAMARWSEGVLAAVSATSFALMVGTFTAAAEERPPPAIACGGAIIARGTATRALDGRGFVLADGREVRLSGIEVPPLPLPDRPDPAAGGGEAARQALAAKFAGSEIVLRQAEAQPTDRYGRWGRRVPDRSGRGNSPAIRASAAGFARVATAPATAPVPWSYQAGKTALAGASLAFGPVRTMNCLTPNTPPRCWPSAAGLRWLRARSFGR